MQALLALPAEPAAAAGTSAQDLLLTALSVAGHTTAAPLADGILRLYECQLGSQPAASAPAAGWRANPLSRALLSNAAAAQPLVLGAARLLARAAESSSSPSAFAATLSALRPFLSFLLLDPQLAAAQPLLPGGTHSALARVACCTPSPAAQLVLLRLLADHLPALRLTAGDPSDTQQAAAAVADVMDVLESCAEEPGRQGAAKLQSAADGRGCCVRAAWTPNADMFHALLQMQKQSLHWLPTSSACATRLLPPRHRPCCSSSWRRSLRWQATGLQQWQCTLPVLAHC